MYFAPSSNGMALKDAVNYLSERRFFSRISIFLAITSIVTFSHNYAYWNKDKVVQNDVISYYGYLPGIFIYKDLSMGFLNDPNARPSIAGSKFWYLETPEGGRYFKMPIGESIMMTPFFLMAHATSITMGLPSNGYNYVYDYFVVVSAWFYAFLAMLILSKILRHFGVRDFAIGLTILCLFLGTNLFYYSTLEAGMSHIYGFFLFVLGIHQTIKWHQQPSRWHSIALGLIIGMMIIVRPTNLFFALFPLFYNVASIQTLKDKWKLFFTEWKNVMVVCVCAAAVVFIQLFAWKAGTGHWFIYSYGEQGFHFDRPEIWKGLFSYRKGWFLYSPVLLLAIPGFYLLWKRARNVFLPSLFVIVPTIYVILSWWCWWYGGSFGMRALIELSAIMAIPLALLFDAMLTAYTFWIPIVFAYGSLDLNDHFTEKYAIGQVHPDSMSKEAYWYLVTHKHVHTDDQDRFWTFMDRPSAYSAFMGKDEREITKVKLHHNAEIFADSSFGYEPALYTTTGNQYFREEFATVLNVSGGYNSEGADQDTSDVSIVVSFLNVDKGKEYLRTEHKGENMHGNWNYFEMQVPIEYGSDKGTELRVYLSNPGKKNVHIKNLLIVKSIY